MESIPKMASTGSSLSSGDRKLVESPARPHRDQLEWGRCRWGLLRRSTRLPRLPDGLDHISALPDDLLLQILARLRCARTATHTSLVSRRWRGLWTRLPELTFNDVAPSPLGSALAQITRPAPSLLHIAFVLQNGFTPAQVSSLLRAATLLAPVELIVYIPGPPDNYDADAIQLPCFDRTASITIMLARGSRLTLPPAGDFLALESLSLCYCFVDFDELLRHCPRLRKLSISGWQDVHTDSITLHSSTLVELVVLASEPLQRIDIEAPLLKKFTFDDTFSIIDGFSWSLSAPMLEEFSCHFMCWSSTDRFGVIWTLCSITLKMPKTLGNSRHVANNRELRHRSHFRVLSLIIEISAITNDDGGPFGHEISQFAATNFYSLELIIRTREHVFGGMMFHILGLCSSIQGLKVIMSPDGEGELCSMNCPCDQPDNWRSQSVSLTHLKEVEIVGFKGEGHELDLLKLLLRCATKLERLILRFSAIVSQSDSGDLGIHSILQAYPSVKCNLY